MSATSEKSGKEVEFKHLVDDIKVIETAAEIIETGAEIIEISSRNAHKSHIAEVPHLPHEAILGGGAAAHLGVAVNSINKVAAPLSVVAGVASTGYAVYEDYENGTTRNTVETIATIGGGILSGHGGALGGAALGTALFPGIGSVVGGVIGAIGAGLGGALTTSYIAKWIGDSYGYNLVEKQCKNCGKKFKVRQYLGQTNVDLCDECYTQITKNKIQTSEDNILPEEHGKEAKEEEKKD